MRSCGKKKTAHRAVFSHLLDLRQGIVLVDPLLNLHHIVIHLAGADDHAVDTGVDNEAAAHGAGGGMLQQLTGGGLTSGQIHGGAEGVPAGGGDDGVHLGMDAAAQLIALAGGAFAWPVSGQCVYSRYPS